MSTTSLYHVILEDTWLDDDCIELNDIHLYCTKNKQLIVRVMKRSEIEELNCETFFDKAFFCNTEIVQSKMREVGSDLYQRCVPDTYDPRFQELFKRRIRQDEFGRFFSQKIDRNPVFIKPVSNDKLFDGRVVVDPVADFVDYGLSVPDSDTAIYICDPYEFAYELRLFVGNGKLYGQAHMRGPTPLSGESYPQLIDSGILERVVQLSGSDFLCVDIGFGSPVCPHAEAHAGQWMIVELNPPFSLDDYDLCLDTYMNYCLDACAYISNEVRKASSKHSKVEVK
eukprot:gnl/Dysnectes_brevis/4915_a6829_803.p1 GENE.gnl/Dysnectes_brevis/4915_a6829_803~~gnl/Dysnectes_brevis/4915_a6829_803.p1  ORF type:complete len:283 (+),score=-16.43 gnl/Dysnectes_brevis/4915_a6829_803:60-908(+)